MANSIPGSRTSAGTWAHAQTRTAPCADQSLLFNWQASRMAAVSSSSSTTPDSCISSTTLSLQKLHQALQRCQEIGPSNRFHHIDCDLKSSPSSTDNACIQARTRKPAVQPSALVPTSRTIAAVEMLDSPVMRNDRDHGEAAVDVGQHVRLAHGLEHR